MYSERVSTSDVTGEIIYSTGMPMRGKGMDKTEMQLRVDVNSYTGKKTFTLDILQGAYRGHGTDSIIGRFNIDETHLLGLLEAMKR